MHRLTNDQLREMLEIQDSLNRRINPDWLTANYCWTRAIRVECAELSDHLGWKWWKKQVPNYAQAHIELVDIWHFMLSSALVEAQGDKTETVKSLNHSLMWPHDEVMEILGRKFSISRSTLSEQIDMLSAFASVGYTFVALFEAIMVGTGLTWEALRRMYLGKVVLNEFRQANGYADGSYQKLWRGEEDNVHLERLLVADPAMSAEQLRAALQAIYSTLPANTQQQLPLEDAA